MITIIHGEDTAKSRNSFYELKSKVTNPVTFDGNKVQLNDMVQVLEGSSLFSDQHDVFIEDFFAKRKGKDFEDIISFLQKRKDSINIYFWEGKDISAKNLGLFKGAIVQHYKYPQVLFAFLDSLGGKPTTSIQLFHEVLENSEAELVFFMLIRHFRILLALSGNTSDSIDEVKRMSPWQLSKFQKQLRMYPNNKLKNIYKKLLEIDLNHKTGKTSLSLTQDIDFLLLEL